MSMREVRCHVCGARISEGDALCGINFQGTCSQECYDKYYMPEHTDDCTSNLGDNFACSCGAAFKESAA